MIVFLQKKNKNGSFFRRQKRISSEKKGKNIPKISESFYLKFATALRYGTAFSNS